MALCGVYLNNHLIIQRTADLYVNAKGVIDLAGRPWPRYFSTIGYERLIEQLKDITPVYREFLPNIKKKTRIGYWFHPELVLTIIYYLLLIHLGKEKGDRYVSLKPKTIFKIPFSFPKHINSNYNII